MDGECILGYCEEAPVSQPDIQEPQTDTESLEDLDGFDGGVEESETEESPGLPDVLVEDSGAEETLFDGSSTSPETADSGGFLSEDDAVVDAESSQDWEPETRIRPSGNSDGQGPPAGLTTPEGSEQTAANSGGTADDTETDPLQASASSGCSQSRGEPLWFSLLLFSFLLTSVRENFLYNHRD